MKISFKKSILLAAVLMTMHQNAIAAPVEVKPVLSSDKSWYGDTLPGYQSGTPEMKVVKFKIAPGAITSTHLHPINGAGYIISGELTMYATSDAHGDFSDPKKTKKITLKPGEAWNETVNVWHYGVNNGDKDVEFVVVFAGQKGIPAALSLTK